MSVTNLQMPKGHEWCTTSSRRKKHISANLTADRHAPRKPGRAGRTLCGASGEDEERANHWLSLWGGGKTVRVLDLWPCALCTRTAAKTTT